MGRSTSSCFKIITCGSDSVDKDDLERTESSKGSTDKCGWSFRKKSGRHRVLSNSIVIETPSGGSKERPESTTQWVPNNSIIAETPYGGNKESSKSSTTDFHAQTTPTIPEKISESQWKGDTTQLSTTENSELSNSLTICENASQIDHKLEESVVIVIQAVIRRYLAQRALLKLKNLIKLQAVVRGHLVRRQATGTLRCVQAIVKLQTLVRARRARVLMEGPIVEDKEKENLETTRSKSYTSLDKLLRNEFARQLLESTSKPKQIHFKCDPSKPNSAWIWLERWMSLSSKDSGLPHKSDPTPDFHEQGENTEITVSRVGTEVISQSVDLSLNAREKEIPLEVRDDTFNFHDSPPTSSTRDDPMQPQLENELLNKAQETSSQMDSFSNQIEMHVGAASLMVLDSVSDKSEMENEQENHRTKREMHVDATSPMVLDSVSDKSEMENEQEKHGTKRATCEQLETEDEKFESGSKKASFIAAQSKFEELASITDSGRPAGSTFQDVEVESKLDILSSPADPVTRASEHIPTEYLISHDPRVLVGDSECGTELSITSTFDTPDISEVGGGEFEVEGKVVEKNESDLNGATKDAYNGNLDVEANNIPSIPQPSSSYPLSMESQATNFNEESVNSVVAVDSSRVEQLPERSESDVQIQLDTNIGQQRSKSSPEGSPRSHVTAPEPHGTPSSQVSVKSKTNQSDNSGPTQRRKSRSFGKRSPLNLNQDSGARSSTEQLPKDPRSGKRRNSFGSARPDNVEQEPRDSNSSNSLPNYMQATESARAKAHVSNSPRSSPDVHDRDISIKKRHSLPVANGKQGSPRIQRSMSQTQSGAKGNGTHTLPEKKWQR